MPRLPVPRPISQREAAVLSRMLNRCAVNGPVAVDTSVEKLKVVAHCDCGCDTVEFEGIDWAAKPTVIADGKGTTEKGDEVGIIIFSNGSCITSLEVNHYDEVS